MQAIIFDLYQKFKSSSGVSTDTRNVQAGNIFFALKGDNFNGNKYAQGALDKGAAFAVIDEVEYATDERFILTDGVLETLQNLARYHRQQLKIPVVGLTGSNGKTTTKELIACVLSRKFKTYFTKGNLNNHIGVPLTLLEIDGSYEIAVVEMGANHQKEIELLASITQPTHGLITNIGKAHLEGFGGVEGIKKGKGELYDFLEKSAGTVFVNAQSAVLLEMASTRRFNEVIYYLKDERVKLVSATPFIQLEIVESETWKVENEDLHTTPKLNSPIGGWGAIYHSQLTGIYNFENIVAALAIGEYFGVEQVQALDAVCTYNPTNNRSQMVKTGTNTILLDAYNANPSSMRAAIQNFINLGATKKIVILGDMLELGEDAPVEHLELGKLVASGNFDLVVLYGNLMQHALPALPKAYYFTDKFSIHNWLQDINLQNAHILIKGSRGVGLETTVQFLG